MIKVDVRFKLRGQPSWTAFDVAPEAYFWHGAERPWSIDSEPEHQHPSRLVPDKAIEFATVRVTDRVLGSFQNSAYHYWNDPEDYVCLVTWSREGKVQRELIFSGRSPHGENGSQVIRVALQEDVPVTTMNCFMWGEGGDEHQESMLRDSAA